MGKLRPRRPSASLVVAFIALMVALGGTSYAAVTLGKNTVGSKQLKKNAVTTAKIKNGAVTASKIQLKTLGFQPATLPSGATETGVWNLEGTLPSNFGNVISLRIPLAAAIPSTHVQYISHTASFTAQCPGFGKAAKGYFCVYEGDQFNTVNVGAPYYLTGQGKLSPGVGPDGATIFANTSGSGYGYADGDWAVTAP